MGYNLRMRSVPEDFEQIHIPTRVLRSMEKQNLPIIEVSETIHYPDRVSRANLPGRWVAERDIEGGSTIQVVYTVRTRPPEPYDDEWAEIEAERAVEVAAHTADGGTSGVVELSTAVVVKLVTRTN